MIKDANNAHSETFANKTRICITHLPLSARVTHDTAKLPIEAALSIIIEP
jgi:hypothetical protein